MLLLSEYRSSHQYNVKIQLKPILPQVVKIWPYDNICLRKLNSLICIKQLITLIKQLWDSCKHCGIFHYHGNGILEANHSAIY